MWSSGIPVVRSILEKHPWYESRWQSQLARVPESQRVEMLFMLAARWVDTFACRLNYNATRWHYINFPFKPPGKRENITPLPPDSDNILSALAENQQVVLSIA